MNVKILSGSHLKLLAVITMVVDHLAAFWWYAWPEFQTVLFTIGHRAVTPYLLMRLVGRLSFPIFAFLIVEGFRHTHDRKRYGINLAVFAVLSEIPWNLVHGGWTFPVQNIFFTLLLGYLGLCAIERYRERPGAMAGSLIGLLAASILLRPDYGCSGYGFIVCIDFFCFV